MRNLPQPWQSVGAKGVVTLASKLMLALLPVQTSFFKLQVDESQLGESFIWNLISKDSFLLPITNNLVKKVFDTQKFFPDKDTPQDFGIWRTTRNNDFYTFIYPNTGHPNIKGHQIFANWFKNNINKSI